MPVSSLLTVASLMLGAGAEMLETPAPQPVPLQILPQTGPLPDPDTITTAEGCTYRRAQAPGAPARWVLVLDPDRLVGDAVKNGRCRGML